MDTPRQHDLVGEYRLLVYPILPGAEQRMFRDGGQTKLTLKETRPFEAGRGSRAARQQGSIF